MAERYRGRAGVWKTADVATAREQRRALVAVNLGAVLEFYDWLAYLFLIPYFGSAFFPATEPGAVLLSSLAVFAVGSLARPLGAIVLGRMGDRIGRRPAMLASIGLMAAASAAMALLPTSAAIGVLAPVLLVSVRILQGFALGPEGGASVTLLAEVAPDARRGLFTSSVEFSVAVGGLLVAGVISILQTWLSPEQMSAFGWRAVFGLGAVLALTTLAIRRRMPETDHADAATRRARRPMLEVWRHDRVAFLRIVIVGGSGMALFYGFTALLPSLGPSYTPVTAAAAAHANTLATLCLLVMVPIGGLLSDRIGRAWTLRLLLGVSLLAFPAVWFMESAQAGFGPQFTAQMLASVLTAVWAGGANALYPELLPPRARAFGVAAGFGIGVAVFGGFAPMAASGLVGVIGLPGLAWFVVCCAAMSAAATIGLHPTARLPLPTDAP